MEEHEFEPFLEPLYDRLTRGYIRIKDTSREELPGGWCNIDEWVMRLFDLERDIRQRYGAQQLDRPLGSMKTKESLRKGAYSEVAAIAYARWKKRSIQPEVLQALYTAYNSEHFAVPFDEFLDERAPRMPYERLLIVTPTAIYSGYSAEVERCRFVDGARSTISPTAASIARSMRQGLSERRPTGRELSDLFEGEQGPPFLIGSRERARSLSR